ncbi:MAG: uroporphyrinogen-III C-methyltransferase [Acidobacteria bacterium]|nr:uroporphyrinogen-III C-methyltransferase [Acidobacteriota bacterium]MBI3424561.1 uroporphyrinogen-III C-methyltransferase [Acidobacteriota bacterium]
MSRSGKVYLVGAGPGDPGLLTVKGRDLLAGADCVIYDYLVNPEIVGLARAGAELLFVGKRGGQHCIAQDEINRLLLTKAAQHGVVVRLKGGDPFVFGRGGEEAEALAAAGIAWEVVPGVSAGIAVPAYAGIPVTQRGISSSVAFITAHDDPAQESAASRRAQLSADTLVFFMGVARIEQLVNELLAHGRAPTTPVAVIRWGTRAEQEVYTSDLRNIAALLANHPIKPPALIVVGEVVRLRERLRWFAESAPQSSPSNNA